MPEKTVQIGKVIGAHGIGGAVKVYSYAESADYFASGKKLMLVDARGKSALFEVLQSQPYKKIVRLIISGVTTRDQAEALTGADVFIDREDLPPLDEDTFYWSDLIGMDVYTVAGEHLGRIEQIIPTGANDVYVVKTPAGHPLEEILIPAIASVVVDIDVALRCMRVELPEGLV